MADASAVSFRAVAAVQPHHSQDTVLNRLCQQLLLGTLQSPHPVTPSFSSSPSPVSHSFAVTGAAASHSRGLSRPVLESLALPSYQRYVATLAGMHLSDLEKQPESLRQEVDHVQQQMADLCFAEYKAFVTTDAAYHFLLAHLKSVGGGLDTLLDQAPKLEEACSVFIHRLGFLSVDPVSKVSWSSPLVRSHPAGSLARDQARVRLMLHHDSMLADLLAIPDLMGHLVRNAHYDEALDLLAFLQRLRTRYRRLAVVDRIEDQVRSLHLQTMIHQFLAALHEGLSLHAAIRIVGYLKRLRQFTDLELRLLFLESRVLHFHTSMDRLRPRSIDFLPHMKLVSPTTSGDRLHELERDVAQYLKAALDFCRSHFIDIITQYQAIFVDAQSAVGQQQASGHSGAVLSSCLHHLLHYLLHQLETHLVRVSDPSTLSSLMTQSMHCGIALGRKGFDIRPQLVPIFERNLIVLVQRQLDHALDDFRQVLSLSGWNALRPAGLGRSGSSAKVAMQVGLSSSNSPSVVKSLAPPLVLLDYPALASLTNGFLEVFNSLRLIPILRQARTMLDLVCDTMHQAARLVASLIAGADIKDRNEEESLVRLMTDIWTPYLLQCLCEGVYGGDYVRADKDDAASASSMIQTMRALLRPTNPKSIIES